MILTANKESETVSCSEVGGLTADNKRFEVSEVNGTYSFGVCIYANNPSVAEADLCPDLADLNLENDTIPGYKCLIQVTTWLNPRFDPDGTSHNGIENKKSVFPVGNESLLDCFTMSKSNKKFIFCNSYKVTNIDNTFMVREIIPLKIVANDDDTPFIYSCSFPRPTIDGDDAVLDGSNLIAITL